jgi:hypothetical protein
MHCDVDCLRALRLEPTTVAGDIQTTTSAGPAECAFMSFA